MESTIHRGLDGVNIDTTEICDIDGQKGELIYRGYDIRELADKASFEEVIYLLWNDDLPTKGELGELLRKNSSRTSPCQTKFSTSTGCSPKTFTRCTRSAPP